MTTKKKILIIIGSVMGGLALVLVGVFGGIMLMKQDKDMETDESWLTDEQLTTYVEVVSRPDLIEEPIEIIQVDEITPTYVDGVDYQAKDIANAFEELYDIGASSLVVERNQDSVTTLLPVEFYSQPQIWTDMGDVIVTCLEEQSPTFQDSVLRDVLRDPELWTALGETTVAEIIQDYSDEELSTDGWGDLIQESAKNFVTVTMEQLAEMELVEEVALEELNLVIQSDFDEVVELYLQETYEPTTFAQSSDNELEPHSAQNGYIKAKDYPISYKASSYLYYRESLSPNEQMAYDVMVTAIQGGQFVIRCDMGVNVDEFESVVAAIRKDFPEFFFLAPTYFCTYDTIREVEIIVYDKYKEMGIDKVISDITVRMNPVVSGALNLSTEIDKVKYVVDEMCQMISYANLDVGSIEKANDIISDRQDLWSAIVWQDTVCAGYSAAFHYYMKLLGIDATSLSSDIHAWNLLELDGEYYYMDVTAIDTGGKHKFFNFNDQMITSILATGSMPEDSHQRTGLSDRLPAANGTKYYYYNWFETKNETDSQPIPTRIEYQTVLINGKDVSKQLGIFTFEGVLYAEGKSFVEAFAAQDGGQRWFQYQFSLDEGIRVTDWDGKALFTVYLRSRQMERPGLESIEMRAIIQYFDETVLIPMKAFCEGISKMGYHVELEINGERYIYPSVDDMLSPTNSIPGGGTETDDVDQNDSDGTETDDVDQNAGGGTETDDGIQNDGDGIDIDDVGQNDGDGIETDDVDQNDGGGTTPDLSDDIEGWDIPEWYESSELIKDWQQGPVSLEEPMKSSEVVTGLSGTYVGYYAFSPYQYTYIFNEDSMTGIVQELSSEGFTTSFTFKYLEDVDHPFMEKSYNGMLFLECEDGSFPELVVVSPTVLYEPQYEAIFYRVD